MINRFSVKRLLLACVCLLVTFNVNAKDYLIEVVLFENVSGRQMETSSLYYPVIENSLNLNTPTANDAGFIQIENGLTLTANAAAIASSSRYNLLSHFAWRQPGLAEDIAPAVRLSLGGTRPMYLPDNLGEYEKFIPAANTPSIENTQRVESPVINGTIKVHLGRFLHMETRLTFNDNGQQQSYRLGQNRKMRSRELHYIDNPRFGILTRILPLDDKLPSNLNPDDTSTAIQ